LSDIVVGIDAGASKTRAFAVDRAGTVVGRGAGGGGNLLTSPDPQGAIAAALAEALGGRGAAAIVLSCAGGDRETERARGQEILMRLAPPGAKLLVTHDAKVASAADRIVQLADGRIVGQPEPAVVAQVAAAIEPEA